MRRSEDKQIRHHFDLFKLPGPGEVQVFRLLMELVAANSRTEDFPPRPPGNYGVLTRKRVSPIFKKEEEDKYNF